MQTITQRLANPTRFMGLSGVLLPLLWTLAGLLLATGLYLAATAPPDYQHGHTVKIMFVHVPCAWIAMMAYALVAASSFGLLVFAVVLVYRASRAVGSPDVDQMRSTEG